jgi:hypothetical protein
MFQTRAIRGLEFQEPATEQIEKRKMQRARRNSGSASAQDFQGSNPGATTAEE